uniref:Uncharacterized protein n=1 Tax=Oryza glumipatula TaxID=40148 RepID=A0A0D9YZ71_9ORYZ
MAMPAWARGILYPFGRRSSLITGLNASCYILIGKQRAREKREEMVDVKHTAGHAGARRVKLFRVPRRPARAAEEAGAPLVPAGERRKRKMAVARLGGGAGGRRRLFGAFRRLRSICVTVLA